MKSEIITIENGIYPNELINKIAECINQNMIVIMPSDTIYGFLTKPENEEKLRAIKKRDNKPFLYLISNLKQMKSLKIDYKKRLDILNKYWPGKITFIMENEEKKTVGLRLLEWNVLIKIIEKVDEPVLSTSVNYSGMQPINNIKEIINEFDDKVDLIIIDKSFKAEKASTIVDITSKPFKVIRKGSVEF